MTAVARWISILAHPFVMVAIMVTTAGLRHGTPAQVVGLLAAVFLFTILPLMVLMIRRVRGGAWENVDASNTRERPMLFAVGLIGLGVLLALLLLLHPRSVLFKGAIGTLAMLTLCAVATRWLKVSLHMAFGALTATTLLLMGSWVGWLVLLVLPVLAWSRLELRRHRRAEIVAGALIGGAAGIAIHVL